jgi:delta endotoxin, N-terminal domain/Putative Ig domain
MSSSHNSPPVRRALAASPLTRRALLRRGVLAGGAAALLTGGLVGPARAAPGAGRRGAPDGMRAPVPGPWPRDPGTPASPQLAPDIANGIRTVVLLGLGEIPEAGSLISGLVGLLWPADNPTVDVWGEIEAQVEAAIQQALDSVVEGQVSNDLQGLKNNLNVYTQYVQDPEATPAEILGSWNQVRGQFNQVQPDFEWAGYEALLLPLLGQMANLHLALLRDAVLIDPTTGVANGLRWGMDPTTLANVHADLATQIQGYRNWVSTWFPKGQQLAYANAANMTPTLRWDQWNAYTRQATLSATDQAVYWPYFDPSTPLPQPAPPLTREIYSDPQGRHEVQADWDGFDRSLYAPITRVRAWGGAWAGRTLPVLALQAYYGGTAGPVEGNSSVVGGQWDPPAPFAFDVSTAQYGPIVAAWGSSGLWADSMGFDLAQGGETYSTPVCGDPSGGGAYRWQFDGHILSSVRVMGVTNIPNQYNADCLVYGFRYADSYTPALMAPGARGPLSLPAGTLGRLYRARLGVPGSVPPVRVTLAAGTLPAGLRLRDAGASGLLVGVPTQTGTYAVTVRTTDRKGAVATRRYRLVVTPAAPRH